jgi:predicted CopG family antitoxin
MAKHKISISFKRKYHDVYVYLNRLKENNENVSDYICKLVQADMNKEQTGITISQSEIEKMILEALRINHQALPLTPLSQPEKVKKDNLSEEDINLLNNLF